MAVAIALCLFPRTVAEAGPITYDFTYTAGTDAVPSFSFSFELPDYVTTQGMFALPDPITVGVGGSPGVNTISYAGTNECGEWVFGNSNEFIGGCGGFALTYDGPAFMFFSASPATFVTAPGSVAFGSVFGYTQAVAPQVPYSGTASLTVTDTAAVPEPASLSLLGVALAGIGVRRWRQRTAR